MEATRKIAMYLHLQWKQGYVNFVSMNKANFFGGGERGGAIERTIDLLFLCCSKKFKEFKACGNLFPLLFFINGKLCKCIL